MNRRSLFKRIGAVAVAASIPASEVVAAEPDVCSECEWMRSHPVQLPAMFERNADMDDAVIALAHNVAIKQNMNHRAAVALISAQIYPSYQLVPISDPGVIDIPSPDMEIRPMSMTSAQGEIKPLYTNVNQQFHDLIVAMQRHGFLADETDA